MSTSPTPINLNDTTPASPNGEVLVKWQGDNSNPRNVSAYVPFANKTEPGAITMAGDLDGTGENPIVGGVLGYEITQGPSADGQILQFTQSGTSDTGAPIGSLIFRTASALGLPISPAVFINGIAASYEPIFYFNQKATYFNGVGA